MNKQELRDALERSFEIDRKFFRSFSVWDRLGLSCFSNEEIEVLDQRWLHPDVVENDFDTWLENHDDANYQRYKLHLDAVRSALKEHTNVSDCSPLVSFRRAYEQLAD